MAVLKKVDFLFIFYLSVSTLLLFFPRDSVIDLQTFFWVRVPIILVVLALIFADQKITNPVIKLLRSSYPLIVSGYFYSETVIYNHHFFSNLDPILVNIETALFSLQPSIQFSAHFSNKLFSELMYFGYFSFYLLILSFTLYMFISRRSSFSKLMFQLNASLYTFFLIFCFIPSEGPQYYFLFPENKMPDAYFFDQVMHFIQRVAEQPTGAFPSSHVGISLIILMLSKKYASEFYRIAWPLVIILVLSTVYIKAHYVIDVIGGLLIAPFILYLSNFLYHLPAWKNLE